MRIGQDSKCGKARAVLRRDQRHDRSIPDVPKHRRRKDTVRWCRGHVGREHVLPEVHLPDFDLFPIQRVNVECQRCHLDLVLERRGEVYEVLGSIGTSTLRRYMYDGPPTVTRNPWNARMLRRERQRENDRQYAEDRAAQTV